jgi:effector-binding domain-containing protein
MIEKPTIGTREAKQFAAIATAATMEESDIFGPLHREVYAWLESHGAIPSGPSFVRILTSDMTTKLDIEVGVPVDDPITGDDRITVGEIPPGWYVTLFYTEVDESDHIQANVEIQEWAAKEGLEFQIDRSSGVEVWGGRFNFFHEDEGSDRDGVYELTYQVTDDSALATSR